MSVPTVVICVDSLNVAVGAAVGKRLFKEKEVPLPQEFTGVTVMVPVPLPTVTFTEVVVLVPLHPIPETVHV